MKIRITSVTDEAVGTGMGEITVKLEDTLSPLFEKQDFGVQQFVAVVVAVYADEAENEEFSKAYNKLGNYKHLISGERVKYLSLALPLDPSRLKHMSATEIRYAMTTVLLARLDRPPIKLPKTFKFEQFCEQLRIGLEIVRQAC